MRGNYAARSAADGALIASAHRQLPRALQLDLQASYALHMAEWAILRAPRESALRRQVREAGGFTCGIRESPEVRAIFASFGYTAKMMRRRLSLPVVRS